LQYKKGEPSLQAKEKPIRFEASSKKFDNFMGSSGYTRCQADHCCYVKHFDNSYIILLLYVDDMLIAGSSIEEIDKLKQQLSKQFEVKDLGAAK
jgi:ATP-binding cassette subfamily B (MDR/TAP) protein 1